MEQTENEPRNSSAPAAQTDKRKAFEPLHVFVCAGVEQTHDAHVLARAAYRDRKSVV